VFVSLATGERGVCVHAGSTKECRPLERQPGNWLATWQTTVPGTGPEAGKPLWIGVVRGPVGTVVADQTASGQSFFGWTDVGQGFVAYAATAEVKRAWAFDGPIDRVIAEYPFG